MLDKLMVKLLTLKTLLSSERGQDLVEYALLVGIIAVAFSTAAVAVINSAFFGTMAHTLANCLDFNGPGC